MILKEGMWLESNKGEKWEIIELKESKISIRKYHKGATVGTITGITLKDIKTYFKM